MLGFGFFFPRSHIKTITPAAKTNKPQVTPTAIPIVIPTFEDFESGLSSTLRGLSMPPVLLVGSADGGSFACVVEPVVDCAVSVSVPRVVDPLVGCGGGPLVDCGADPFVACGGALLVDCGADPFVACGGGPLVDCGAFVACGGGPLVDCGADPFVTCGGGPLVDCGADSLVTCGGDVLVCCGTGPLVVETQHSSALHSLLLQVVFSGSDTSIDS